MRKFLIILLITPLLTSCFSNTAKKQRGEPPIITKDQNAFNILMSQFANNIENTWGRQEVLIAGSKDYVKYTDNYKTRSHINFDQGIITVETLIGVDTEESLRQVIVTTLLMGDDPDSVDLYSDVNDVQISKEPFLFGQVLDQDNNTIRWEWRANKYADYLIANKLQKRSAGVRTIWSITIQLTPNHLDQRAHKYLPYVRKAAHQYGVDVSLILAIMQIESSFNPYAVSHADALGLMQVVQHTAGVDVFKMKGQGGKPSRNHLFDPENNIDTGTAYLHILQEKYLNGITNPTSRRYAVITAYNGGAGSVLRIFSSDRDKAVQIINKMQPGDVYQTLTTKHPSEESRNYLNKVNTVQKNYRRHPK